MGAAGFVNVFCVVIVVFLLIKPQLSGATVKPTFIENAVAKGAVCLDGSPGAYYFVRGSVDKWFIHLQGGAWCNNVSSCLDRANTPLGSTKNTPDKSLGTIFGSYQDSNPDFYEWNKVIILYCDGASFMADVEAVDPETNLHFRGRRIFTCVMEELLAIKGMNWATDALLGGDSAGGLAAVLNCDRFHSFLP